MLGFRIHVHVEGSEVEEEEQRWKSAPGLPTYHGMSIKICCGRRRGDMLLMLLRDRCLMHPEIVVKDTELSL